MFHTQSEFFTICFIYITILQLLRFLLSLLDQSDTEVIKKTNINLYDKFASQDVGKDDEIVSGFFLYRYHHSTFIFAKEMNATTISLPSSHASLVSHPTEIAQLILNATKGITK